MIQARLQYDPRYDDFDLWVREKRFNGETFNLKIETIKSSELGFEAEPFISAHNPNFTPNEFVQAILDTAWENGMRPKGFKDTLNEVTALKEHLADMRRLTFAAHSPYNIIELKNK